MAERTTALGEGDLWLPSEFPYEYGSVDSSSTVLSSPVESVVSSTGSESDGDEFLAGSTRRFSHSSLHAPQNISHSLQNLEKKPGRLFGSPESTLTTVGSWSVPSNESPNAPSQFPSSPLGQNDDNWDLIYAAAGQVTRLKMNGGVPNRVRGILPIHPSQLVKTPTAGACTHRCLSSTLPQSNHFKQVSVRQDEMGRQQSVRCGLLSQSPCLPRQIQHPYCQNYRGFDPKAVFLGGFDNGVKKSVCAGTGVFLPRRYGNPTEPRKKPECFSTPPPRARVSQPQNKNYNAMAAHIQVQPQAHPRFNGGFIPHYDADNLMARRNAVLVQQKLSLRPEMASLPQDWTY